jgi:prepilin-type N-terminal cleavage/methylation domain-containing protein
MIKKRNQAGVSLIEFLVALTIFAVLASLVTRALVMEQKYNSSVHNRMKLQVYGEMMTDNLRKQLSTTRLVFDSESLGADYWSKLSFSGDKPDAHALLPTIQPSGSFSPDWSGFDSTSVGNMLFWVKIVDPPAEVGDGVGSYVFDRFRFVVYFLVPYAGGKGYNLVSSESQREYLDYNQIMTVLRSQPEYPEVFVDSLKSMGLDIVWRANAATAGNAFYNLSADLSKNSPINHTIIMKDSEEVSGFSNMSGAEHHGIAPNGEGVGLCVPKFAKASTGFPNGFEVLVAGPANARKVLLRFVLLGEGYGRSLATEHTTLMTVREY